MDFLRKSLSARLIFYFLLLSLVPVAIVGLTSFIRARQALQEAVLDQLIVNAALKEDILNRWIIAQEKDVTFVSLSEEITPMATILLEPEGISEEEWLVNRARLTQYLFDVRILKRDFAELFILNLDGEVVASTKPENIGLNYSHERFFREGQLVTSVQKVYLSTITGQPALSIGAPLLREDSRRLGVFGAHLDIERMDEIILDQEGGNQNTNISLVDSTHHLILSESRTTITEVDIVESDAIEDALSGNDDAGLYQNHMGVTVFGAYRWVDDLDVALLAEISREQALDPVDRLALAILFIGFIAAGILVFVVRWLTSQIAEPIITLTNTAVRVTGGDLSVTATVRTEDEIGILARTFNQMTEQLRRVYLSLEAQVSARTTELATRVEQLDLINRVGRNANAELNLDNLLPSVTLLIRQTLRYYAVMILLIDEETNTIQVLAADAVEDYDVLAHSQPISLEVTSIITQVANTGQALVVNDVSTNPLYLSTDFLPKTRSELALPLVVGDKILGVLDLQSEKLNPFAEEDVQVLQTLADQIAVAIQNTFLFREAQEAQLEAEEANRLKTQFLANMSHELRTPLNAVINFAYLLSMGTQGPLTEGQEDMLQRIGSAGHHLLNLINDILDLAKIESGRLDLYLEDVELPEIVSSVMSTAIGLIKGKELELRQEVPDDIPLVLADHGRIRQVLLNLVSNAAKFTEEGHILVQAKANGKMVIVSVADTGIGMAAEDIPKAFAEFIQIDGGMTRKVGGTGLGLPISKRFVEMHGGEMWVESEIGQGTTFFFTLPVAGQEQT